MENYGTDTTHGATLMLVARDINANGARFCPLQLQANNKKGSRGNHSKSWTEYYDLGQLHKCFWLCKDGYSGEKCNAGNATTCNSTDISIGGFADSQRVHSGANIENEIPMFYRANSAGKDECDMILAISSWTPSGHGAYVQPTVFCTVRAGEWRKHMYSVPVIEFVSEPILMCMDGYRKNSAKDDCEAINQDLCNLNSMCTGWAAEGFKSGEHTMYKNTASNCFEYRCMMPGYGFVSTSDRTCKECNASTRYGVPGKTGECIICPVEKIFDENADGSSYCVTAVQIGTGTLQYGPQKSRTTQPLLNQCWTQVEPSTYKKCTLDPKWDFKADKNN